MTAPSRSFRTPEAFRTWLERNHAREGELIVRCFKVHARDRGITYPQVVDEVLCWGWIDGVRRALDADSFTVRVTPRRAKSIWSAVNIRRARELDAAGRMADPGRAAFEARRTAEGVYSFESKPKALPPAMKRRFQANKKAFAFWSALPPGYRRTMLFWILSAKQAATQEQRLDTLIEYAQRGQRIPLMGPVKRAKKR